MGSSESILSPEHIDLIRAAGTIGLAMAYLATLDIEGLPPTNPVYKLIEEYFKSSAEEHVSNGIVYTPSYQILKIIPIRSKRLWEKYKKGCTKVKSQCDGILNEKLLFHGTSNTQIITNEGFNTKLGRGMFGQGTYFATNSSKSNQYVFQRQRGGGCSKHKNDLCTQCTRRLLVCKVALGKVKVAKSADSSRTSSPWRYASIMGRGGYTKTGIQNNLLKFDEYVVYDGKQVYPAFFVEYKMVLNNYRPQKYEENDPEEVSYSNDSDCERENTNFSAISNLFNQTRNEKTDYEDNEQTIRSLIKYTRESRESNDDLSFVDFILFVIVISILIRVFL